MKNFFENFKSKKFLMALIAMVAGIMGLLNCDDNTIALVTNIILVGVPAIVYIITEGVLDWNKINTAIVEILNIIDDYMASEKEETEEEIPIGATKTISKEKEVIYKITSILRKNIKE